MANTFELIASATIGSGGAADITFTSILPNWTDLCLMISARDNAGAGSNYINMKLNGSASGFSGRFINGAGSGTPASSSAYPQLVIEYPGGLATANTFGNGQIYFPNYAGSTFKSYSCDSVGENNATTAYANLNAGLWSNTAAITSITLTPNSGSFVQYTNAYLYGVKNA